MKNINYKTIKIESIYIYLLILSLFYIFLKYIFSFIEYPNIGLILKIIYFSDTEYFDIVESLSRFDFYLDRSKFEVTEKIFGFPLFSVLIHSFFFKVFGFHSFLILEFIFNFILCIILFKIFNSLFDKKYLSLALIFFLYSTLLLLEFGQYFDSIDGIAKKIHLPIVDFIGNRFPRPMVTSIFAFYIVYSNLSIIEKNYINIKSNIFFISISLMILANSFFYLFITLLFASFLSLYKVLYKKFFNLIIFIIPIILGLLIVILQQYLSEPDYEVRIGVRNINLSDKIFLIKYFFLKILQYEIISLILFNIILLFQVKKNFNNYHYRKFLFIFLCFVSSIISPFIFIIISNKIISLYYFWTGVKFFGFFCLIILITKYLKNKFSMKWFYIFLFAFIFISTIKNYKYINNKDSNLFNELDQVYKFLKEKNFESDLTFYGETSRIKFNQRVLNLTWLSLNKKYLMFPPGFSSALKDSQIENLIFYLYKSLDVDQDLFTKLISDRSCGRDCFALYFTHKYSVNSLKYEDKINLEYSLSDQRFISKISPIIWWHTIINNSEKNRLIKKYTELNFDETITPDIIVLDKNHKYFKLNKIVNNYDLIFETDTYFNIFKKKIN